MAEEIKGDSRILLYGRMDTVIAIALGKGHVHACVRVEDLKVIAVSAPAESATEIDTSLKARFPR